MKRLIITLIALAACNDVGSDDSTTTTTPATTGPASSSSSGDSSSDGGSSSGTDGSSDGSSDGSTSTGGVDACDSVVHDVDGVPTTCCCSGGAPEAACPDGLAACTCDVVSSTDEHGACGSGCDGQCGAGLTCRDSYAGGYLAECSATCDVDDDCSIVGDVCAAGWCVTPCSDAGECPDGTWCYPPAGAPNPAHPIPHCMPRKVGT